MKQTEKTRKQRKKKLTFLDYVIIASLVFFAIGLFSRYTLREKFFETSLETKALVSFEIHAQSEDALLFFGEDTQFSTSHGEEFGILKKESLKSAPAKIRKVGKNGEIFELPSKTLFDIYGEIVCVGAKTEGGFFLSGVTYLAPNMHFSVKNGRGNFEIYITNIEIF